MKHFPTARLRVKVHPADTTAQAREVLRRHEVATEIVEDESAGKAILRSDVVMVVSSTTGLEACAAGRPLLLLRLNNERRAFDYAAYGAALEVRSAGELAPALGRILNDDGVRSSLARGRALLLADALCGRPGAAAQRAAAALKSLRGLG